ncbi:MAG: TspO/MBR family protein [Gemmataceae bacterium]
MSNSAFPRERVPLQWVALALFLLICLGAAGLGAALTNLSVDDWYAALRKPAWNPPNWLFGPVWTALYIGMAVAAWLVWRNSRRADVRLPLLLFGVQWCLNVLWSAFFFGLRSPALAFADVVPLWLAILATIIAFWRVSVWAAALLFPYLAWVSFATALNAAIWRMNA